MRKRTHHTRNGSLTAEMVSAKESDLRRDSVPLTTSYALSYFNISSCQHQELQGSNQPSRTVQILTDIKNTPKCFTNSFPINNQPPHPPEKYTEKMHKLVDIVEIDIVSCLYVAEVCIISCQNAVKLVGRADFSLQHYSISMEGKVIPHMSMLANPSAKIMDEFELTQKITAALKNFYGYYLRSVSKRESIGLKYLLSLIKSYLVCSKLKSTQSINIRSLPYVSPFKKCYLPKRSNAYRQNSGLLTKRSRSKPKSCHSNAGRWINKTHTKLPLKISSSSKPYQSSNRQSQFNSTKPIFSNTYKIPVREFFSKQIQPQYSIGFHPPQLPKQENCSVLQRTIATENSDLKPQYDSICPRIQQQVNANNNENNQKHLIREIQPNIFSLNQKMTQVESFGTLSESNFPSPNTNKQQSRQQVNYQNILRQNCWTKTLDTLLTASTKLEQSFNDNAECLKNRISERRLESTQHHNL